MSSLFGEDRGAEFSGCGRYRYRLWRTWDNTLPTCCFVMLNPSTADAEADDPTIRRCLGYARDWGYGGLEVVNLFALRATDPREMLAAEDPVGPHNDGAIGATVLSAGLVVAAWGADGKHRGRSGEVRGLLRDLDVPFHALKVCKDGEPGHPLYLSRALKPEVLP